MQKPTARAPHCPKPRASLIDALEASLWKVEDQEDGTVLKGQGLTDLGRSAAGQALWPYDALTSRCAKTGLTSQPASKRAVLVSGRLSQRFPAHPILSASATFCNLNHNHDLEGGVASRCS